MHEASLAQGLLKLVEESVRSWNEAHPDSPARSVTSLRLQLGLVSCVEEQTFRGCFELIAEGTVAQEARLDIEREPLPCTCRDCRTAFTLTERRFVCPACKGRNLDFKGGHALTLVDLEASPEAPEAGNGTVGHAPTSPDHSPKPHEGPQEEKPCSNV